MTNEQPLAVVIVGLLVLIAGLLLFPRGNLTVDPGGSIPVYTAQARMFDGPLPLDCRSACTMYLARGCVTPEHRLTFHTPTPDTPFWRQRMADHYPAPIARWFMELPSSREVYVITGTEAIRLGARQC